jgi:hypothetical protein
MINLIRTKLNGYIFGSLIENVGNVVFEFFQGDFSKIIAPVKMKLFLKVREYTKRLCSKLCQVIQVNHSRYYQY